MPIDHLIMAFAATTADTKEQRFNKQLILIIALSCSLCGLIWGAIYYYVFGAGVVMMLPWSFVVLVALAIIASHVLKNHRVLVYTQLICITWISALIQWSIGSMHGSGLVICWSFLGPLGALIFLSLRSAMYWMLMFLCVVVISAWKEPALLGAPLEVSQSEQILFYIMNIGMSLTVVFAAAAWFVNTIQKEKLRSDHLANRIQSLLGQHISNEVADQLISGEEGVSKSEYFDATIMFVDIRDFTQFADSRAPREVGNFQNTVFSEFINIVKEHNGVVLHAMGDGIMAVFGAPVKNSTHPEDAVKAGMKMVERMEVLSDTGEIPKTVLGIGLHSGKIIAGEVGNDLRKFYTISGSTVIVAARTEQLNKHFASQFLVTQSVFERIRHLPYNMVSLGSQELKGLSRPIEVYKII